MTGSRDMPWCTPEGDKGVKALENTFETEIQGTRYTFSNKIETSERLFDSFNRLADKTFGLSDPLLFGKPDVSGDFPCLEPEKPIKIKICTELKF